MHKLILTQIYVYCPSLCTKRSIYIVFEIENLEKNAIDHNEDDD